MQRLSVRLTAAEKPYQWLLVIAALAEIPEVRIRLDISLL